MRSEYDELQCSYRDICVSISAHLAQLGADKEFLSQILLSCRSDLDLYFDLVISSEAIKETLLYQAIANYLALPYQDEISTARILSYNIDDHTNFSNHILLSEGFSETKLLIAPNLRDIVSLQERLSQNRQFARKIVISPPSFIQKLNLRFVRNKIANRAVDMTPAPLSASRVMEARQAFIISLVLGLMIAAFTLWFWPTLLVLHVGFTLFFFSCVSLRLLAARKAKPLPRMLNHKRSNNDLPIYSILVPLYKEANIVPQIVAAMEKLYWPKHKLGIKFICEEEDLQTQLALHREGLSPHMTVLVVPDIGPQTKPKALNFALQCAKGEFIAIYDAEDRPHPLQLIEAYKAFMLGGERLACVQAPLIIGNFRNGFLPRMFAFEYAALFRGMLPWFSARQYVLPLGGTSNHFRKSALSRVGGWDAFNVTEDADLGLRLSRFGYKIDVIACGTIEDAPENFVDWYKQRTRWFKGWMQTTLVHLRQPIKTKQQLGLKRFLVSQIYMLGLIMSALIHPFLIISLFVMLGLAMTGGFKVDQVLLMGLDVLNISLAYLSFYVLGRKTIEPVEAQGYSYFPGIMLYWLLMSFAAWRAAWQLFRHPFLWEKTPHFLSEQFIAERESGVYLNQSEGIKNSVPLPIMSGSSSPIF